jgi:hypothetical protein
MYLDLILDLAYSMALAIPVDLVSVSDEVAIFD